MTTQAVGARGQVTIPKKLREKLGLMPGTPIRVEEHDGVIVLRTVEDTDPDQAWFWTPEFQAKLEEAEEDLKTGRTVGPFDNAEDLIAALHRGWPADAEG